jgi:hypothetical protein
MEITVMFIQPGLHVRVRAMILLSYYTIHQTPVPVMIQIRPLGYFVHIYITTPVVPALEISLCNCFGSETVTSS